MVAPEYEIGDVSRLSVVELEHVLRRALAIPLPDDVATIRAELGRRTWQNINPYADAVPVDP